MAQDSSFWRGLRVSLRQWSHSLPRLLQLRQEHCKEMDEIGWKCICCEAFRRSAAPCFERRIEQFRLWNSAQRESQRDSDWERHRVKGHDSISLQSWTALNWASVLWDPWTMDCNREDRMTLQSAQGPQGQRFPVMVLSATRFSWSIVASLRCVLVTSQYSWTFPEFGGLLPCRIHHYSSLFSIFHHYSSSFDLTYSSFFIHAQVANYPMSGGPLPPSTFGSKGKGIPQWIDRNDSDATVTTTTYQLRLLWKKWQEWQEPQFHSFTFAR